MMRPTKIAFDLFDESEVRQNDLDAGFFRIGEGDAAIDHQPFALAPRADAIERDVHADFAEATKRHEDQFAIPPRPFTPSLLMAEKNIPGLDRMRALRIAQDQAACRID